MISNQVQKTIALRVNITMKIFQMLNDVLILQMQTMWEKRFIMFLSTAAKTHSQTNQELLIFKCTWCYQMQLIWYTYETVYLKFSKTVL